MRWVRGLDALPPLGELVRVRYGGNYLFEGRRQASPRVHCRHQFWQTPRGAHMALTPEQTEWQALADDPSPFPACACGLPSTASARQAPPYLCARCAAQDEALRAVAADF